MRKPERRPEVKAPLRWQFREPERFWLDNGMQLLLAHREGQHIASVALLLDSPLSLEPAGRHGVATITQRCLDEGTTNHPGTSFSEALEDIGAELSGAAGFSATEFYLDVPVAQLTEGLELLAEAVRQPTLGPDRRPAPPAAAAGRNRARRIQLRASGEPVVPGGLHPAAVPGVRVPRRRS